MHGSWVTAIPSRFVSELPEEHIDAEAAVGLSSAPQQQGFGGFGGSGFGGGFGGFGGGGFKPRPQRQAPGPVIEGSAFEVAPRRRPDKEFARGARVFHQKFGYGTVRASEGDKLEIEFEQSGIKKVLDSFVVPADQAG
jgi:DNA helicase-2/ATP-dependent DNA helicase PcrA